MRQRIAIGIIRNNGSLLLCQRPSGKIMAGYWEFPGGKNTKGESSRATVDRELKEELGIRTMDASFLLHHYCEYPHGSIRLDVWHITDYKGNIHGNERQKIRWCPQEGILKFNLLPTNRPLIHFINHYFE